MRSIILSKKILIIIILIGAFQRFYKLVEYPVHLNHDEITQLYDAISIAQTGKDIYGNFLPFIFPSVGDFKPPFYTYITTLFYFIFGWSELTIRLPGAIFGVLIIPAIYFFVLKFLNYERTSSGSESIALIAAFFTAIAPFEIYFSRKSFENGAGIFLMLIGFLCLFKYFANKQKFKWLYFSGVVFSAGMYTYFSHAIIIPLLVAAFIFIYRDQFSINFNRYLLPILFFIILIFPLIFMIFTNPDVKYRSQTVFISQDVALGKQLELVKSDNLLISAILQGNVTLGYIFERYLSQFDPIYLFANGLDLTNQDLLGLGPLFLIQLPFLILGIIFLIRSNLQKEKKFILVWVLLGMLPSALTFESHSPHRVTMVFTMFNIISAVGFYYFLKLVKPFKYFFYLLGILILALVLNFIYLLHIYFVNFPFEKSHYLQYPFKEVAEFAWSQYDNFEQIVFDPQFGDIAPFIGTAGHYYLAYYGHYPPRQFQEKFHTGINAREVIFDKFSIRQVYWPKDKDKENTLFIVSIWSVPLDNVDQSLIIKKFNFYNGNLAFYAISK